VQSETQSYLMAGIISCVACQHRELQRLLIIWTLSLVMLLPVRFFDLYPKDRIDIHAIFDSSTVDEDTLDHLLVAVANPDIAKEFSSKSLKGT
jgi:hypothetical protein